MAGINDHFGNRRRSGCYIISCGLEIDLNKKRFGSGHCQRVLHCHFVVRVLHEGFAPVDAVAICPRQHKL